MESPESQTLTGVHDADRLILLNLDDSSLQSASSTNKYLQKICDEEFWQSRFVQKYGGITKSYLNDKTYKSLYIKYSKMPMWKVIVEAINSSYVPLVSTLIDNYCNTEKIDLTQLSSSFFTSHDFRTAFKEAIFRDDYEMSKCIIDKLFNLQYKHTTYLPINAAAQGGALNVFILLLEDMDRWYIPDDSSKSLEEIKTDMKLNSISMATEYDRPNIVKYLIEQEVDYRFDNDWLVYIAAIDGSINVMQLLLENGVDPNARNALCTAILNTHFDVAKLLVECGANILDPDVVKLIVKADSLEFLKFLHEKGLPIDFYGNLALKRSAASGKNKLIKYLIENVPEEEVDEALITAVIYNQPETVELLLKYGVDIHTDHDEAVKNAVNIEMLQLLVKHGADIHADHDEALKIAAKRRNVRVVTFLLDNSADPAVITRGGKTILALKKQYIKRFKEERNCEALTKAGNQCKNISVARSNFCHIHQKK